MLISSWSRHHLTRWLIHSLILSSTIISPQFIPQNLCMHACLYHLVRKCTVRVNLKMTRGRPSRCCRLALSLSLWQERWLLRHLFVSLLLIRRTWLTTGKHICMLAQLVLYIYHMVITLYQKNNQREPYIRLWWHISPIRFRYISDIIRRRN
jgi:hypothetical protein